MFGDEISIVDVLFLEDATLNCIHVQYDELPISEDQQSRLLCTVCYNQFDSVVRVLLGHF